MRRSSSSAAVSSEQGSGTVPRDGAVRSPIGGVAEHGVEAGQARLTERHGGHRIEELPDHARDRRVLVEAWARTVHPAMARTAATSAERWLALRAAEPSGSTARPRRAGEAFAHDVAVETVNASRSAASQLLPMTPTSCAAAIAATLGRYSSISSLPTADRSSCAQIVRRPSEGEAPVHRDQSGRVAFKSLPRPRARPGTG